MAKVFLDLILLRKTRSQTVVSIPYPQRSENVRDLCLCHNTLRWCHSECDGVSNLRRPNYLLNPLFRCRSKKTLKIHVTGLCEENPSVTGGFPSQRASYTENVSIRLRHHAIDIIIFVANYQAKYNPLGSRQNGRYFPDDIFKHIFFNETGWISLRISLKFIPIGFELTVFRHCFR